MYGQQSEVGGSAENVERHDERHDERHAEETGEAERKEWFEPEKQPNVVSLRSSNEQDRDNTSINTQHTNANQPNMIEPRIGEVQEHALGLANQRSALLSNHLSEWPSNHLEPIAINTSQTATASAQAVRPGVDFDPYPYQQQQHIQAMNCANADIKDNMQQPPLQTVQTMSSAALNPYPTSCTSNETTSSCAQVQHPRLLDYEIVAVIGKGAYGKVGGMWHVCVSACCVVLDIEWLRFVFWG